MAARVLITRRMPEVAAEILQEAGLSVELLPPREEGSPAALRERVRGCTALLATLRERIDRDVLEAAGPALRVVANCAVGFDNIDVPACTARGVRVTNTPDVLTDATADLAWALVLAAARRVVEGDQLVRSGRWAGWEPLQLLGLELTGATLGVIGAGRIGAAVARRSLGFRMRVFYCDVRPNPQLEAEVGAQQCELERLLRASDVVSLHVPLTMQNVHLIGAAQLAQMKPTAVLVNTSRGPVIDEAALVDALRTGRIAAAGLDVYENEPRLAPGLAELPNVVLLPHLGSATTETRRRMAAMAAENVVAVLAGRPPPNPVNLRQGLDVESARFAGA